MIPLRAELPLRRRPAVSLALAACCLLVFLWQTSLPPAEMERALLALGAVPALLTGAAELAPGVALVPIPATVLTSLFVHGGWLHLAGNLLYLWIFGPGVESRIGHAGFLALYLACGALAVAAQVLPDPGSPIPMVGASGAISGILGASMVLHPNARVLVLVPLSFMLLHHIRAGWLLALWLALQLTGLLFSPEGESGIAFNAHVGGFLAGVAAGTVVRFRTAARTPGPWG